MAKVVCVLYDDPIEGYPASYARDELPRIDRYPHGQSLPTPRAIDFRPGVLLGSVSGELGLRKYLESNGHELVVTSDKDGSNSVFERELVDAEVVISQPFWPAYLTAERIAKASKLKLGSPPASAPITSISRLPWIGVSPWPKSPTATRSAWPSTRS
jgi:formate dehydrogenase